MKNNYYVETISFGFVCVLTTLVHPADHQSQLNQISTSVRALIRSQRHNLFMFNLLITVSITWINTNANTINIFVTYQGGKQTNNRNFQPKVVVNRICSTSSPKQKKRKKKDKFPLSLRSRRDSNAHILKAFLLV